MNRWHKPRSRSSLQTRRDGAPQAHPRNRLAVITAAVAAVAVLGELFGPSAAAAGRSVILGTINKSSQTTTLKNTADKPALDLRTRTSEPPMRVSSKKMVSRLNANYVGGHPSTDFLPQTLTYSHGQPGDRADSVDYYQADLPPGHYAVTITAGYDLDTAGGGANCYVFDFARAQQDDPTRAVNTSGSTASNTLNVSGAGVINVTANSVVLFVCAATKAADIRSPITATFTPLPRLSSRYAPVYQFPNRQAIPGLPTQAAGQKPSARAHR